MSRNILLNVCRKVQGKQELGWTCLQTPGTCESCPEWWQRRTIKAYSGTSEMCQCCGKNKARRKGKSPAPVRLIVGGTMLSLCMTCAKKISSVLDSAIIRIESKYAAAPTTKDEPK